MEINGQRAEAKDFLEGFMQRKKTLFFVLVLLILGAASVYAATRCNACSGYGSNVCTPCGGSGKVRTGTRGTQITYGTCVTCKGTGRIICRVCNGSGWR